VISSFFSDLVGSMIEPRIGAPETALVGSPNQTAENSAKLGFGWRIAKVEAEDGVVAPPDDVGLLQRRMTPSLLGYYN
jgi:hypothetical protein